MPVNLHKQVLRPLLRAYSMGDPERGHALIIKILAYIQERDALLRRLEEMYKIRGTDASFTKCGITLKNRIGVSGGFDKNARVLLALQALGVGFVEAGTVTPTPQLGNPRPRMILLEEERGLLNSLGFPNVGAVEFRNNVLSQKERLRISLGINVGIGAGAVEDATYHYTDVIQELCPIGDYLGINISSPNTPGLTSLQEPERLESLIHGIVVSEACHRQKLGFAPRPILVKLSDLGLEELPKTLDIIEEAGASGIIIPNTSRKFRPETLRKRRPDLAELTWGYSGKDMLPISTELVSCASKRKPNFFIIGGGGVHTSSDALALLDHGADAVQVYGGLVYEGFKLIQDCREAMATH